MHGFNSRLGDEVLKHCFDINRLNAILSFNLIDKLFGLYYYLCRYE